MSKTVQSQTIYINIPTTSRYTKSSSNNMAVVEVTIPSGFEPDMETIGNIRNLQRTEQLGKNLVFYFSSVSTDSRIYDNLPALFYFWRNILLDNVSTSQ